MHEETIAEICRDLTGNGLLLSVLDAIPEVCFILSSDRRVVFANKNVLELRQTDDRNALCGLRPGEALDCVHAYESESGCGSTKACKACGVLNQLLISEGAKGAAILECRILRRDGEAIDLRVRAVPMVIEGRKCIFLTGTDISHEKRRKALENIFFHDLVNTAGALRGFCELFNENTENPARYGASILKLSTRLLEEIDSQKQLLAAESNDLAADPTPAHARELLERIADEFADRRISSGHVRVDPSSDNVAFTTDVVLLRRVIGNLVKNAFEASEKGETVSTGCRLKGERVEFWIHNNAFMPQAVQNEIFHRSFSTKDSGRGLGTYSAKLLTERYLKGTISFASSRAGGTIFTVSYPLALPREEMKRSTQPRRGNNT
jgi:signal transduction histidine kinase